MWRDLRYAVHSLLRAPLFTLSAVLALGVAIGANATIFGLVDALWLRPPGVTDHGALVRVFATSDTEREGVWSYPEYTDMRDRTRAFSHVVARGRRGATMLDANGTPELLLVNVVSLNFFDALGINPHAGRLFTSGEEAQLEAQPAVVLGHTFWLRRFGGDPAVVGRTVTLGRGTPVDAVVLGVLPPTFRELDAAADRDLWVPTSTWVRLTNRSELERREERWFDVFARRAPGTSVEAAAAEVNALMASLGRDYPDATAGRGARVISDLRYRIDSGGTNAQALLGLVLLVVIITCVNVANLLLARASARAHEIAVRVAIGATRWRLLRQMLAESAVIGLAGSIAGVFVAMWLIHLLPALIAAPPGFRSFVQFQTDGRVLLFTLAMTLLTTLLFGLAPAWAGTRTDVVTTMKTAAPAVRRRGMLPASLVTAQVAISLVLLCAAGLLVRSFVETQRADIGLTKAPVLTAWVTLDNATPAVMQEGARQIESLAGVTAVAIAIRAPMSLSGGGLAHSVHVPGTALDATAGLPRVKFNAVSAAYFRVMGTRVVRGRVFTPEEERHAGLTMLVNQQFAERFFPGQDPLGKSVRIGSATGAEYVIVGVTQNAVINRVGEAAEPYMYLPYWRGRYGEVTYLIASAADPANLAAMVRDTLKRLDAQLEPRRLITMKQYFDYSASSYHATAWLAFALGAIGLLLTAIGVYGVIAYRTARRTREIGIRLALGADRAAVLRLLARDGVRIALVGAAIGLPAALAGTRAIESMLFGVPPWDVAVFAGAALLLIVVVTVGTLVPSWRAARIQPTEALRDA